MRFTSRPTGRGNLDSIRVHWRPFAVADKPRIHANERERRHFLGTKYRSGVPTIRIVKGDWKQKSQSGFTLIELLLVILTIAILAIIFVLNLENAGMKAKYVRVKADLWSLGKAIESYRIDHKGPPLDWSVKRGDPKAPGMSSTTSGVLFPGRVDSAGNMHAGLTTPVAYISDCWMTDPYITGASYKAIPFDQ